LISIPFPFLFPFLFLLTKVFFFLFSTGFNSVFSNSQIQRSAASRSLVGILRNNGSKEWLKTNPYLMLLQKYLEDFLGSKNDQNIALKTTKTESFICIPDLKFHSKMGQLLICLACEYWMDTATIVRSHSEYAKYTSMRSQNRTCRECCINCIICLIVSYYFLLFPLFSMTVYWSVYWYTWMRSQNRTCKEYCFMNCIMYCVICLITVNYFLWFEWLCYEKPK
jgi:hypothetical protein